MIWTWSLLWQVDIDASSKWINKFLGVVFLCAFFQNMCLFPKLKIPICSKRHRCLVCFLCSFSSTSLVVSLPPSRPWKRYACNGIQISNLAFQGATMVIYGPLYIRKETILEVWDVMRCWYMLICIFLNVSIDYIFSMYFDWCMFIHVLFVCLSICFQNSLLGS